MRAKYKTFSVVFCGFDFENNGSAKKLMEKNASILQRWIRRLLWLQFFKKFWFKKAIEKEQNDATRILQGFGKVLRAKKSSGLEASCQMCIKNTKVLFEDSFGSSFKRDILLKLAEERQQNDAAIVIQIFWRMAAAKILRRKAFEKKIMDAVIALQGFRKVILAKGRKKTLMEIR